jgi:murein DD-endopeptidase MepM/ murein hydrolase activator NlpD
MMLPVDGHITSYFGYRYHPILHFTRFHAGMDFGAAWGSPIVAAADGQVAAAGWSGGYGRQVRLWHGGGLMTTYSHMSDIVATPGSFVRRGQLIGYVGSSGLSTGPHLHYEVLKDGTPVNPLGVRFVSAPVVDAHLADAVRARLKALLSVGIKRG